MCGEEVGDGTMEGRVGLVALSFSEEDGAVAGASEKPLSHSKPGCG